MSSPITQTTHANMDHVLNYKTNLNKCKRIEVLDCVFQHHEIRLEINNVQTTKSPNIWKQSNRLLHNTLVKGGSPKGKLKIY